MKENKFHPIAVVGVSALFPGAEEIQTFWKNILDGKDLISDVPSGHWLIDDYYSNDYMNGAKTYVKRGGFLPFVDFDPVEFGMPPKTLSSTDSSQLLALLVAQQVLEDSYCIQFDKISKDKISVILGVASGTELLAQMAPKIQEPVWRKVLRECGLPESQVVTICEKIYNSYADWDENTFPGLLGNVVAGRIANKFNLGGTNCVVDAACAGSHAALTMAIHELQLGHSDLVISGGVDAFNDIFMYMCFTRTPALSKTGDCRPFSSDADGTILSEGLGMIALRRLSDAQRDGDKIYAVIKGIGTSSDGKSKSVYAPNPDGQAKAIINAYEMAGYGFDKVSLVEAHGTGTTAGDIAEFEGLRKAMSNFSDENKQFCALGSIKSQIGHAKAASGSASVLKAIMALHNKVLPPTIKIDKPNPKLNIENSPFYLNTKTRPWISGKNVPRRAGVSAFGFGGSNFHMTLEEYIGEGNKPKRILHSTIELMLFSADSFVELQDMIKNSVGKLTIDSLGFIAKNLQIDFNPHCEFRFAILIEANKDVALQINFALEKLKSNKATDFCINEKMYYFQGKCKGEIAFLFPGQGSQYVNMNLDLTRQFDIVRDCWDQVAEFDFGIGERLHDVVFPMPVFDEKEKIAQVEKIKMTQWAQPAIGITSASQLKLLNELGVFPKFVAGHSYGEITALFASGVISNLKDFVSISRMRGELMAEASKHSVSMKESAQDDCMEESNQDNCKEETSKQYACIAEVKNKSGSMTAVFSSHSLVESLINDAKSGICVANVNSPNQIVISGETTEIEAFEKHLSAEGIFFRRLPVATAFHSKLVEKSAEPFCNYLKNVNFSKPNCEVFSNTTGNVYPQNEDEIKMIIGNQLARPVLFMQQIQKMYEKGARIFVEIGPGSILSGLTDECLKGRDYLAVSIDKKGTSGVASFWNTLGLLSAAGIEISYNKFWDEFEEPKTLSNKRLSSVSLKVNGSNLGKPYPPLNGAQGLPKPNPEVVKSLKSNCSDERITNVGEAMENKYLNKLEYAANLSHNEKKSTENYTNTNNYKNTNNYVEVESLKALQKLQDNSFEAYKMLQNALLVSNQKFMESTNETIRQITATRVPHRVSNLPYNAHFSQYEEKIDSNSYREFGNEGNRESVNVDNRDLGNVHNRDFVKVDNRDFVKADNRDFENVHNRDFVKADNRDFENVHNRDFVKVDNRDFVSLDNREFMKADNSAFTKADNREFLKGYPNETLTQIKEETIHTQTPGSKEQENPCLDYAKLLIDVVSEKTGYPTELIKLDMEVETELGIDSIKRVEILSALRSRTDSLKAVEMSYLASLKTLREIVDYISSITAKDEKVYLNNITQKDEKDRISSNTVEDTTSSNNKEFINSNNIVTKTPQIHSYEDLLIEIVAEKTGYPKDIINTQMELETELGVDSIKRVEILSALRVKAPELAMLDISKLSTMKNLKEILDYSNSKLLNDSESSQEQKKSTQNHSETSRVLRYIPKVIEAPALGVAMTSLINSITNTVPVYIVRDNLKIAESLDLLLKNAGINSFVTDEVPSDAISVIYLKGLNKFCEDTYKNHLEINEGAFDTAKIIGQNIMKKSEFAGLFVTVQDTGGDFGIQGTLDSCILGAGISGLVKTASKEWVNASVKAIDIERDNKTASELAKLIFDEILGGGNEIEVGIKSSGLRVTIDSEYIEEYLEHDHNKFSLMDEDVLLVSGGARGITADCIKELALGKKLRIALFGRSKLIEEPEFLKKSFTESEIKQTLIKNHSDDKKQITPIELSKQTNNILASREILENIKNMNSKGSIVEYFDIDITNLEKLKTCIDVVRKKWGNIKGIIHGAGVLADKYIHEKSQEQFRKVFNTKVAGLYNFLEATKNDGLTHICCFSSVSARFGNKGQSDYSMANEILNKVSKHKFEQMEGRCLVKSINWGPWDGGMVTPSLKAHFEKNKISLIPVKEGTKRFVDEISNMGSSVEVIIGSPINIDEESDEKKWFIRIHKDSHPFMQSHKIKDEPVVPAVYIIGMCLKLARSAYPNEEIKHIKNLKVLKGIVLNDYYKKGDIFSFTCSKRSKDDNILSFQVKNSSGQKHYTLDVSIGNEFDEKNSFEKMPEMRDQNLNWKEEDIYKGTLFHGTDFRVIKKILSIDENKCNAILRKDTPLIDINKSTDFNTAILDGGFQLSSLLLYHSNNKTALPTGCDEINFYRPIPYGEDITVSVETVEKNDLYCSTNTRFYSLAGELLTEFKKGYTHNFS